jgi:PPOX class probable F420-dependent enzyme
MPRTDRLSPGAVKLLEEKQIAQLATVMPDGSPQLTPVWVDVEPDGSHVLVNTAEGRVKTRNVERDPRVALSVVDSQNPYRYAIVRGEIVERRREGADEHIDRLSKQYLDKDIYPFRTPDMQRVILRIKPSHVLELGTDQ